MKLKAQEFYTYMFMIVMFSWLTVVPLIRIKCLSLSPLVNFSLKCLLLYIGLF